MHSQSRFRANAPDTVHETFDNEAVLLNLKSGNYYSLNEMGTVVWTLVESGNTISSMVELLCRRHRAEVELVGSAIERFLAELSAEGLIIEEAVAGNDSAPAAHSDEAPPAGPFSAPELRRYTDMQALFLLDPIHEVADAGWPRALENAMAGKDR
ncbi:MAG: PqqD family protein [Candidatus Hydrogenedentes bacterium]|nr:PqqD family protein [Candidatus Hydrogenedentota bacterium]MBI3119091.1 PqqD family protein [Candidatus Hydrogenedentota bacterium]